MRTKGDLATARNFEQSLGVLQLSVDRFFYSIEGCGQFDRDIRGAAANLLELRFMVCVFEFSEFETVGCAYHYDPIAAVDLPAFDELFHGR